MSETTTVISTPLQTTSTTTSASTPAITSTVPTTHLPPPAPFNFPVEAIIGLVIGALLFVILVGLLVCCCCLIKRESSYTLAGTIAPEDPLYTEVKKNGHEIKPSPTALSSIRLLSAEEVPDGPIKKQRYELHELTAPVKNEAPADPTYQEIMDKTTPVKITASAGIKPSARNPMYESADPIDPSFSSPRPASSLPDLKDPEKFTELFSPPVPPFRATPPTTPSFNVPLGPSAFSGSAGNSTHSLSNASEPYLMPYPSAYAEPTTVPKQEVLEITRQSIKKIKDLGEGRFGPVILAHTVGLSLKQLGLSSSTSSEGISILVAVKTLNKDCDSETQESFKKEVKFMSRLKHENVVRLMGVCLSEDSFIMLEYMENGDLSQYLQEHELTTQETRPLPSGKVNVQLLTYMSLQIATGMQYLASLHFIHRDLAARNCYVGTNYKVKIADFGMSHNLYSSVYYRLQGRVMLPIRWMANECFYGQFSEKTDVWAFGITMWEVFTLCKAQPYEGMTDQEVIDDAFHGPERTLPHKPDACPSEIHHVMLQCWVHEPEKRPTFEEVHTLLSRIHAFSDSAYAL